MDLRLNDMYLVDTGSGETHQFGPFPIVHGFYGPVPLAQAQRFQGVGGGQRVRVASAKEMLLVLGVLTPETEQDFQVIEDWIAKLQGCLGEKSMKDLFTEGVESADEPEAEADKAEEEGDSQDGSSGEDKEELGKEEGPRPLPVLPEGFKEDFPGYHEAKAEMEEAGFEYWEVYDIKKSATKPEMMRAYLGYLTQVVA